jgi:hypothetical protein
LDHAKAKAKIFAEHLNSFILWLSFLDFLVIMRLQHPFAKALPLTTHAMIRTIYFGQE